MSLDAMKQALEALEGFIPYLPLPDKTQCGRYDKAITALRAAIEQAEKLRQWQGLTDEEIDAKTDFRATVRYFEAKLKEKNG